MVQVIKSGANGANGASSTTGPGGAGSPGDPYSFTNVGNGVDTTNTTRVTGGAGGGGGTPGGAGAPGGNGTAVTKPNPLVSSTSATITSKATGIGGAGGYGGFPPALGDYGPGASGGNGYASAYAYNNGPGPAYAYGFAGGGKGGLGSSGGDGGIGQIGTVVAKGTTATAVAIQVGGAGGVSIDAGSGGTGGNSKLVNQVGGAADGGYLFLKQDAHGGAGGSATGGGGQAGAAGYGNSQLTFDDTTNPTPSPTLRGYSFAYGGMGGSGDAGTQTFLPGYATPTTGGSAYAKTNLKGAAAISGEANATGGDGGNSNVGAAGGAASAYDRAFSTTTGDQDVTARTTVLSGQGGTGGGAGGNATSAVAKAYALNATGGTEKTGGLASAIVSISGANGGEGNKGTTHGGAGGTVSGASAYASGYSAYAYIRQQGGGGGIGYGVGGVSGTSQESILDNQVTGRTTGGDLTLEQRSIGGIGAEGSSGGTAGAGAYAKSVLDFNDITSNPTHAAVFTARGYAYGGAGGELEGGTGGGAGGAANSAVHIVGAGAVTARSTAGGGSGGGSTGSLLDSGGGSGGNISVSSYAYSTGGTARAYGADVTGGIGADGNGGTAYGAGQTPGAPGVATIGTNAVAAYAAGVGQAAYASDSAQGGHGGYGKDGANASAGAATSLDDTVYGVSNFGTLELRQTAYGGAGGGSTGGAAGQGGNATSTLDFLDKHEDQDDQTIVSKLLIGYVHADAGGGGSGYSGSNGANGGAAVASLKQEGYYQVGGVFELVPHGASAQGGYGGNGTVGGQGGTAQAYDSSTTYNYKSSSVFAYASARGGLGGGGTAGAGGAGGAATVASATATGAKQTGGHAYAKVVEKGGGGGAASGSGNTAGAGGAVSGATAEATGYSAVAMVAQYGGAGGSADTGANGGAGANSNLNDAVSGTTNGGDPSGPPAAGTIDGGYLTLKQTAHGGAGGAGNGTGSGGAAGYGYSTLSFDDDTANTFHAGTLTATVGGYGGNGGVGNGVGTTGGAGKAELTLEGFGQITATAKAEGGDGSDSATGGSAVADASATSDGAFSFGDTATATATATGGFTSGTMGSANADAQAVTSDGAQATATGTAYGADATDQTSAQTTDAASTLVLGVDAATSTSTPFTSYNETMTSGATVGGTAEPVDSAGGTGFSWASGLPTGPAVTDIINPTVLEGQPEPYPQIYDSLNPSHDSDATVLGYGIEGVDTNEATSGTTVTTTQSYYLTAAALAGQLELGLASGAEYGAVNDITLTVTVDGNTELNVGYTSVSQMVTFFTDDMQDLGSFSGDTIPTGGLPVAITLAVTTTPGASTVSGFEGNFVLASSGVVSPPVINLASPSTVIGIGKAATIGVVSISEAGDTTGDTFTVTLTDTHGDLSATQGGGNATITQVSSTDVKIVGSLSDVNDALATLADTNGTSGSDPIDITASDTNGNSATPADLGVTVNGLPVITAPVYRVTLEVDEPTTLQGLNAAETADIGISVAESGTTGSPETFTVDVTDSDGKIAEGVPVGGVTYTQISAGEIQVEGDLNDVNQALGNITAQNVASGTITVTASDSFLNSATQQSFSFGVSDTPAEVEALTEAQINQLAADGVTTLPVSATAAVYLTVQQAGYFAAAGISITDSDGVFVRDTADAIEGMSTSAISQLPGIGVFGIISNNGPVALTVDQALQLEAENPSSFASLSVSSIPAPSSVTLTATIDDFDDPASPTYLSPTVLSKLSEVGFTTISVTGPADAVVPLSVAQAQALGSTAPTYPVLDIQPPSGGSVALTDTVSDIEALQPTDYDSLDQIGIGAIVPTNGALQLSVAQAQAIVNELHATIAASADTTIDDTAADIKGLLDGGSSGVSALAQYLNFTTLNATDGSIALTVTEAENLEQANANLVSDGLPPITVTAPPGDTVTLADIAANIEGMSPQQISGLSALGITEVTSTDTGLTLSVPDALAFYDPLPITVPPGTTIVIADTESEIASLTEQELAGLAALGVTQIQVSGLSGESLTINAGVTLAIDGAVPSAEAITFVGTGGTLSLNDTPDMAGTIYGFSPPDTIDLTDVTYDPTSTAQLDPSDPADDKLQVIANGNTYFLQLDPSQVFLTAPTFNTGEDAGGDTDVTVTEAPFTSGYTTVASGQTADGVVISTGGEVEVNSGGAANRAIIQGGGYLLVDSGATISDAFIQSGGTVELQQSTTTSGDITFGPTTGDPLGGTLDIDDPNTMPTATIANFAPGDVIDLTQIGYDAGGSATIQTGNTLQVVESGNTYDLQLDPSQYFLNQSFALSADSNSGTDITEVQTPVTGSAVIPVLEYVTDALVMNGGSLDIQADGTLNGGTVAAGGIITVASAATFNNGLVNGDAALNGSGPIGGGGVVDVTAGGRLGQTISFGADGGTLQVDGTVLPTATIYGFGGNDIIDLTGIAYQEGAGSPSASGGLLQFTENGTPYSLNIDPAQEFFGGFALSKDAGTGTDITLIQPESSFGDGIGGGDSAAGLEFVSAANGGANQFYIYGSLVNAEIDAGATVYVENGGAISYAVVENGGSLDLANGANVVGPVGFGTPGGILEIDSASLPTAPITNMAVGDTIDLGGGNFPFDPAGSATLLPDNRLQIVENSITSDLQLDPLQSFKGYAFQLSSDDNNGTFVTEEVPCFLPGTHILTTRGDVLVEELVVGDIALTLSGRQRPLCWIGKGSALAVRGRRSAATPIIVRKGALGNNTPNRDLRITKGHSLYLDGVLIPAEFLVNHRSILWDDRAQEVTVYHLELDGHDILIANGAAAESYRDDGNRWLFRNANSGWDQPPKPACAPVLTGGPIVDAVWRRLLERAGPRPGFVVTEDPDLHLVVDGRRLDCIVRQGFAHVFQLADAPKTLRIASLASAPAELGLARDPRALGVAVRRVALRQGSQFRVIEAADPALAEGFHALEPGNGFRWTDGDAALDPAAFDGFAGPLELVLHLGGTTHYATTGGQRAAA